MNNPKSLMKTFSDLNNELSGGITAIEFAIFEFAGYNSECIMLIWLFNIIMAVALCDSWTELVAERP